nr:MAG TPA: hypothetical protein [Caudoviricetes sp.]
MSFMLELIYREGAVAPTINVLFCRCHYLCLGLLKVLRLLKFLLRWQRLFLYRLAFFHLLDYIFIIIRNA